MLDTLRSQGAGGKKTMKEIGSPAASLALAALEGVMLCDIGGGMKNEIRMHLPMRSPEEQDATPDVETADLEAAVGFIRSGSCYASQKMKVIVGAPRWEGRLLIHKALRAEDVATRRKGVAPAGWLEDEVGHRLETISEGGLVEPGSELGFFYDPDLELFKRWHQLGIWYPFYRGHAHLETKRREPWVHGDEVTSMIREQVTARYQLLPMWYTLFAEWSMAGRPVLRPLWFHDLADTKAFVHSDTHFLVGEQILVRAVTEKGAPSLNVYLPKGDWYDYWEPHAGVTVGGAESAVALHPGRVPVYVRRGTVLLKRMRRRRSSGAMAADPYSIFVYGPLSRGRVYIDDGSSHNYQQGDFLYEELIFDGSTLSEAPAPPLPAAAAPSQGAPGIPDTHLRVERVVLYGLASEPTGAALEWQGGAAEPGPPERLQISARKAGDGWTATIKKPPCLLGKRWAIRLAY
ncbi:unnamed protein product [Prorocentrum cordatum]|uniref:DUF5110 domain-containing protein n=1 Tax=Prorocentrum cordatum TaxID=2364126 RepID=A0ABN9RVF7_9DINO|nr:unnamed protein product [Polarella glacialis]